MDKSAAHFGHGALPSIGPLVTTVISSMDYACSTGERVFFEAMQHALFFIVREIHHRLQGTIYSQDAWATVVMVLADLFDFSVEGWNASENVRLPKGFVKELAAHEEQVRASFFELYQVIMSGQPSGERRRLSDDTIVTETVSRSTL